MITPLRRRHRWLAPVSFGLALVGLAAAVAVRPEPRWMPDVQPGDAPFVAELVQGGASLIEHSSGRFQVAFGADDENGGGARVVWLLPSEPLDIPDLLVYSTASAPDIEVLPADARLLGPASQQAPTRFEVPVGATGLLLFSLGHQAVEAAIALEVE